MSQNQSRDDAVKFAYWVPNVSGGLVVSTIEQRTDWSLEYNQKLAQTAEQAGFDYALSQIRFTASRARRHRRARARRGRACVRRRRQTGPQGFTERRRQLGPIELRRPRAIQRRFAHQLIGTPQQIAQRIVELKSVGVDLVVVGFLHFIEEVEYFGKRVLPLVRELERKQHVKAA